MQPETQPTFNVREALENLYDFSDFAPEEKERLLDESTDMIMEASLLRGLEQSGEDVQAEFEKLIQTNPTSENIEQFIATYIPLFGEILQDELRVFQQMGEEGAEA